MMRKVVLAVMLLWGLAAIACGEKTPANSDAAAMRPALTGMPDKVSADEPVQSGSAQVKAGGEAVVTRARGSNYFMWSSRGLSINNVAVRCHRSVFVFCCSHLGAAGRLSARLGFS